VCPQDGQDKQDGELAAARRWRECWGGRYAPWGMTLLGDDRYSHQPFCQAVRRHGFHFLFVCRPDSQPTLSEWVADFDRLGHVGTVVKTRWTGKERLIDTYRYVHDGIQSPRQSRLPPPRIQVKLTVGESQIRRRRLLVDGHKAIIAAVDVPKRPGRRAWR